MKKILVYASPVWGQRIKELLVKRGMTQKELSQVSGVPESTISDWVRGKSQREPGVFGFKAVADTLGVSMDYLMGGNSYDMDTELMRVSGYSSKQLIDLITDGWTLSPPQQITIGELMMGIQGRTTEEL